MFWAFVAALSTGVAGFTVGLTLSRCGICCPPKERPHNCGSDSTKIPEPTEAEDKLLTPSAPNYHQIPQCGHGPELFPSGQHQNYGMQ